MIKEYDTLGKQLLFEVGNSGIEEDTLMGALRNAVGIGAFDGFIKVYAFNDGGTRLEFIEKIDVDVLVRELCERMFYLPLQYTHVAKEVPDIDPIRTDDSDIPY